MTNRPNRQSSNFLLVVVAAFFLLLVGLFIYAITFQGTYFAFLAIVSFLNVFLLWSFHRRLSKKQSAIKIQKEEYFEKANMIKAELDKEWKAIEAFRKKIESYSKLKNLTEKLSLSLTLPETSQTLSREVSDFFGHKDVTVILYLFHSQTGELGISSSQKGQLQVHIKTKKGDMFDQYVVKTLQPLLIEDTASDFRFDVEKGKADELRPVKSLISAPLLVGNKALGILRVDSPLPYHFFQEDLRLLRTIADLAGVAIENAQLYEHIEDLAIRDSLTGLYLRRHMLDRLEEELKRELRSHRELSFLMIDLDHFKRYNDEFGHVAGDIVLRTIARILNDFFSDPGDLVCRYGGEEFCVILPDCPGDRAGALADQVRIRIERERIILRRQETAVTVSIGVASFPKDAQMKEELIYKADHALYRAKEKGRNRVCMS